MDSTHVIQRLLRGNAKIVDVTLAMRETARKKTDAIVDSYEKASGHYTAYRLYNKYCDVIEMRNDRSVEGFRGCMERITLYQEWAKHGELAWNTCKPGQEDKVKSIIQNSQYL